MKRTTHFDFYQILTLAILAIIAIACVASFATGKTNLNYFWTICGLAIFYWGTVKVSRSLTNEGQVLTSFVTVGVMWTLYSLFGTLSFAVMPYVADSWLAQADKILFCGNSPVLLAQQFIQPANAIYFCFIYAVFVPYIYVSVLMSLLGRPKFERKVFITGFAITYFLSFLGYLFLPARGPIVFLEAYFRAPIPDNIFYEIIMRTLNKCGGPHGAFPSLHVGAAWFACLFDLKYNRLRGLLYLPLVIMIAWSTILLRFHYVVDIVAGGIIGSAAIYTAHWINQRWGK